MRLLVLCTGNSCRSQMAEGYLRKFAAGRAELYSAGVETHGLNPKAIRVMQEDGIDISAQTSNNVLEYVHLHFDFVITVCDNALERCPVFPGKTQRIHHNFPDPAKATGSDEKIMNEFRLVRDQIKDFCRDFIEKI